MRLKVVDRRHRLRERLILSLVRLVSGDTPDIMRTLFHRPEFFGRPLGALTNRAMRQSSEWSIAEREMFAAYISLHNRCEFCIACHSEYACQAGERAEVERRLQAGASDDPRLAAAFALLSAFAAGPEALSGEHVDRLRSFVDNEAIRDLAEIAFCFCVINRVADALEFRVPPAEDFAKSWPRMSGLGAYRV